MTTMHSGTRVFPNDDGVPTLSDIALGLCRQIRFAGQSGPPYTVLAHTFVVANYTPEQYRIFALIHDAPEAVMGDTPRPWKHPEQAKFEDILLERITRSMGLPWPWPEEAVNTVYQADDDAGVAESHVIDFKGVWDEPREDMMESTRRLLDIAGAWILDPETAIYTYERNVREAMKAWEDFQRGE